MVEVELGESWAGERATGPPEELGPHSVGEGKGKSLSSSAARLLPRIAPIPVCRQGLGP